MEEKRKKILDIQDGVVIDRIEPGRGILVSRALGAMPAAVGVGYNTSKMEGKRKDIYKAEGFFPDDSDLRKIALISPGCTVNVVREGKVDTKTELYIDREIDGLMACPNENCVSNLEAVPKRMEYRNSGIFRCRYCESEFGMGTVRERKLLTYLD